MKKLLFFLSYLLISTASQAQTPKANDSLAQYFTPVSLQNPDSAWHVLKPAIKGKKLFLFGEVHGVSCNLKLQLSLFKYLHKYANVRYLVLEMSPSEAYLYNRYLHQTESKVDFLQYTSYAKFKETRVFWQELRKFNQGLSKANKIYVFGVDAYDDYNFIVSIFIMFDKHYDTWKETKRFQKMIKRLVKTVNKLKGIDKFRKHLQKAWLKSPDIYQQVLTDDYWFFKYLINNPLNDVDAKNRDKKMYEHLKQINFRFNQGNYMGVFGGWHTRIQTETKSMKEWLNRDPAFKNQLFTIHTQYHKIRVYYENKVDSVDNLGLLSSQHKYINPTIINYLMNKQVKQDITLLPLSRFWQSLGKSSITQDYLLLIKNQPEETYSIMDLTKK